MSWLPLMSFSLPVIAYGIIYSTLLVIVGLAIATVAMFGWALEPPTADDSEFESPEGGDGGEPSKELVASV